MLLHNYPVIWIFSVSLVFLVCVSEFFGANNNIVPFFFLSLKPVAGAVWLSCLAAIFPALLKIVLPNANDAKSKVLCLPAWALAPKCGFFMTHFGLRHFFGFHKISKPPNYYPHFGCEESKEALPIPFSEHRVRLAKVILAALSCSQDKIRSSKNLQILGVSLSDDCAKVYFKSQPSKLPDGFSLCSDGLAWEMDNRIILELPEPKQGSQPLPLFVTLGYQGTSRFFLNLEAVNKAAVRGQAHNITRLLSAIAKELAGDPLGSGLEIFCIGFGYEAARSQNITSIDHLSDILPALRRQSSIVAHPCTSDGWLDRKYRPVLVIDPFTDNPELLSELENLAGKGISCLLGYGLSDWSFDVASERVRLNPLGLEFCKYPSKNETAERRVSTAPIPAPKRMLPSVHKSSNLKKTFRCPELNVLGAVKVRHAVEAFSSLQALSLVCNLAFHRNGLTADQLMSWVWPPDSPPSRQSFANVMSKARRALGKNELGKHYIRYDSGTYWLSPEVGSDLELFQREVKEAEALEGKKALRALVRALDRVRGVPFTGGMAHTFEWADNGIRSEIEFCIDTAVHRLANLAIKKGELNIARWAIRKGLQCIPGCEQCLARLLLAAGASNSVGSLHNVRAEIRRSYKTLGYKIPQSLTNLYEKLLVKAHTSSLNM